MSTSIKPDLQRFLSGRQQRVVFQLFRHRGAIAGGLVLFAVVLLAVFAPVFAPYPPNEQFVGTPLTGPSIDHPLGTDEFGRDILSRIIFGARVSLVLALIAVSVSSFLGTLLGAIAGFFGGWLDEVIMRFMDILFSIPSLILAIILVATFGPNMFNAAFAIAVVFTPQFARVIRGNTLAIKEEEFIKAAYASGGSKVSILLKHVIPNGISEIVVQATVNLASAIIVASGLNFLGLGVQPPTASWGIMLASGRSFLTQAPWISTFPGVAIAITVIAANIFGDGLRDALDPREQGRVR